MNPSPDPRRRAASCLAVLAALLAMLQLAACSHSTPRWDARFGAATRLALAQQVADPQAAQRTAAVSGMDGRAARSAYERYQKSSSDAAPTPAPLLGSAGR